MLELLISLVVVLSITQSGESCSCLPRHVQEAFCNSGYDQMLTLFFDINGLVTIIWPSDITAFYFLIDAKTHSEIPKHNKAELAHEKSGSKNGLAFKGRVYGKKLVGLNGATIITDPNLNNHLWRYAVRVQRVFKGNYLYKTKWTQVWTAGNSAMCGTTLTLGKSMILTGSYGNNRLMTNACQWNQNWETLTIQQKSGLKSKRYMKNCPSCYNQNKGLLCDVPVNELNCYNKFASCTKRKRNKGKCAWRRSPGFKSC